MADSEKISLFGIKELDNFFESMKRADQRRIIMGAWRMSSKPLIKTSRQNLKTKLKSRSTGELKKSIGFVAGKNRGKTVFVSAKVGARRFGNYRGYHGHLFDAGTNERTTSRGFSRGSMPATRFFSDALQQTQNQMMEATQNNIIKSLDKLIQRKLKKVNKPA